jgi:hypothetical protein
MRFSDKVLYKLGLGRAWLARRTWSAPAQTSRSVVHRDPYVFLITSTINTSVRPLNRAGSQIRSVYNSDERFDQTLDTVSSIRDRVPGARILLLENSQLSDAQRVTLRDAVDELIEFAGDHVAVALRDGPHKNSAELYVLLHALGVLEAYDFQLVFKLSGRYQLSDRFDLARFPRDKFGFLKIDDTVSTRLYSVPGSFRLLYRRQLEASFAATNLGVSVEDVIARGLAPAEVGVVDPLGVCGTVAVSAASRIDE